MRHYEKYHSGKYDHHSDDIPSDLENCECLNSNGVPPIFMGEDGIPMLEVYDR